MQFELLSDPIAQFVLLMIAAAIVRLVLPGHRAIRFVANLVFFLLLTTLLLYNDIEPYMPAPASQDLLHRLFLGTAKAIWWIGGAMFMVSSVRMFLIFEGAPREGRLIQDLLAGMIYVGAGLSVVAYVFSVPVGTLIATSGVFAIILGLALQSTLGDVFSGVALNLGRPYGLGDWIVLENGVQGRVVETNWRATHLLNGTNDLVIIPNSALAKAQLVNLSSPDDAHGITLTVRLKPTRPPAVIEEMMRTVLLSSNSIQRSPPPSVTIMNLDAHMIELEIACRVSHISQASQARNEIYDLVYRHAQAAGISLGSVDAGERAVPDTPPRQSEQAAAAWRLLKAMPLFATITDDERESLETSMVRRTYRKGATIIAQGSTSQSLMLVRSGVVVVERDDDGSKLELNRLSPGDCFGERGVLIGAEEPGNIKALTYAVVYEISKEHLATLMQDRPALAEELGTILSRRIDAEHLLAGMGPLNGKHPATLAGRIRHLFQLQHGDDEI